VGKAENPENNRNYEIVIEARQYKSKAYKANIRRRIRCLTCYRRYKNSELGFDKVGNRSNIKSRSKAAARL
jgi:transcriptional regulator NrdR family protein